jgi:Tol biopolymer transport system component
MKNDLGIFAGVTLLLNALAAPLLAQQLFPAVYVMRADGSEVRKVIAVKGRDDHGSPRWSHDSKRLVFNARAGTQGPRASFVVNVDGTGLRELCVGRVPDWSPDDKQIAFQANAAGQIYVQNLDAYGRSEIAQGYAPRWSPDGARLALSDRRMLKTTDLLSGETTDLFDNAASEIFDGFAWSPDGKRLAVVVRAMAGGPRILLLVDADAKRPRSRRRLIGEMGGFVSFSPDGKQIAFADSWQIRIADVDGNAPPRTLPGQRGKNRHPDWSPDGNWIAFVSNRDEP